EVVARIGDARRPGVGDERHPRTGAHALHQLRGAAALDGVVVAHLPGRDAVVPEQDRRAPRVLGGNEIDLGEPAQRPQGHLLEVPDRRRYHVEDAGRAHPRNTRPASVTVRSSQPNCTTRKVVASESALTTPRSTGRKATRGASAAG